MREMDKDARYKDDQHRDARYNDKPHTDRAETVLVGCGIGDTTPASRIALECDVTFGQRVHGNRKSPSSPPPERPKRIPSVSRTLALAIHLDRLAQSGETRTYADLARLGEISRARVSQIMGLANLAPDIQGEILSIPAAPWGSGIITEQEVRPVAAVLDWEEQRKIWRRVRPGQSPEGS